jgi:hypothetical protein
MPQRRVARRLGRLQFAKLPQDRSALQMRPHIARVRPRRILKMPQRRLPVATSPRAKPQAQMRIDQVRRDLSNSRYRSAAARNCPSSRSSVAVSLRAHTFSRSAAAAA